MLFAFEKGDKMSPWFLLHVPVNYSIYYSVATDEKSAKCLLQPPAKTGILS